MNRLATQGEPGVFPMPESLFLIDILVRQVDAAREDDFSIDNGAFAVIAVIDHHRENRKDGVERASGDPLFCHRFGKVGKLGRTHTKIVVQNSNFHALRRFLFQQRE